MYESFFGLREKPFASSPHAKRYFATASAENARQTLARCIERAEGTGLLVGPAGTGKTMLCQVLAEQFREKFEIAMLDSGRLCTRRALLQAILFELGLPYRGLEEGELRLSLIDHLSHRQAYPGGMLLLVDEAHTLPTRLLEEVRMITNLARGGEPRVRLVLAGGPMLEERFANPKLESFNQRLAARCYLAAFDRFETANYVRAQIAAVGGQPDQIFTPQALEAIHRATDGIPRLINQVCDHALILASAGGAARLDKGGIEEAWSDLQQLPTPWNSQQSQPADIANVVEFGSLDDDAVREEPSAVPFPSMVGESEELPQEPVEQIMQIQDQLASLHDEFEPVGSIGPEVELVFRAAIDPFHEVFDEEEVIMDRFAPMETDVLRNRPVVFSREGRELAEMLAPLTAPNPPAIVAQETMDRQESQPADVVQSSPQPAVAEVAPNQDDLALLLSAEAVAEMADGLAWEDVSEPIQHAPAVVVQHESVLARDVRPQAQEAESDDDLILVEDDVHDVHEVSVRPAPVVRRQEYRQLFARLRRG